MSFIVLGWACIFGKYSEGSPQITDANSIHGWSGIWIISEFEQSEKAGGHDLYRGREGYARIFAPYYFFTRIY